MASWRIPMILLALVAFLLGAVGTVSDNHHDPDPGHQTVAIFADGAPTLHEASGVDDECAGLACCMTIHCASCAVPGSADLAGFRVGGTGQLAYQDPAVTQAGRVIAPPTAPPKFA
jgi:hypothetical protein